MENTKYGIYSFIFILLHIDIIITFYHQRIIHNYPVALKT